MFRIVFVAVRTSPFSTVTVKLPMLRTKVSLTNLSVGMVRSSNGGHPSPQSFLI